MIRLILFRFHKDVAVCENRLQLLKEFNPGVEILGLFGGEERDSYRIGLVLGRYLRHIYCISGKSAEWKWKHSDLAIRLWYKDYGKDLSFDMLHVIEWDMLLFNSISQIYRHIPESGVGLTGLTLLDRIDKEWYWTSQEPHKSEWSRLLELVRDKFKYNQEPYACQGPGVCLSRRFLDEYAAIDVPELCHDELRLPLFAQILGFELYDTGFCRKWFDKNEERFFNCARQQIEISTIENELSKPSGRRVFHPHQGVFTLENPTCSPSQLSD